MKKKTLIRSLLILLPVLAVGLATTVNSVMVFDTVAGTTEYYSYFDMIPVENMRSLPPMAAMLSLISGALSAFFLGKKSLRCLNAAGYAAFGGAIAACIPIVIRGEVLVVPNVALPMLMMVQFLVCRSIHKQEQEEAAALTAKKLKKKKKK